MTSFEAAGVILGLANVFLIVRRSVWNYPFGLATVMVYGVVFFEARLYSDVLLQVFFFVAQVYGWWYWTRGLKAPTGRIVPETLSSSGRMIALACTATVSVSLGAVMGAFTDAALPFWDATVTAGSVTAQVLLARKNIENWLFWIGTDVLAIGLFAVKGLYVTAGLYGVFLLMAIAGLIAWRRSKTAGGVAV